MGLVYEWGDGTVTEIYARILFTVLVVIIAICWKAYWKAKTKVEDNKIKQFNQAIKQLRRESRRGSSKRKREGEKAAANAEADVDFAKTQTEEVNPALVA